jgi:uncharacterized damage-inducible protein DinB
VKQYFERLNRHRSWANQQALVSLAGSPSAHTEALPIAGHVLAAEHVWLSRLQNSLASLPLWPSLTLGGCQSLALKLDEEWAAYFDGLADGSFAKAIEYQNSRGECFRNSIADVLTHVSTHGQYHRGQIAKMVGRCGGNAAVTDYIAYVRTTGLADG